jgi:hypothetical protein
MTELKIGAKVGFDGGHFFKEDDENLQFSDE